MKDEYGFSRRRVLALAGMGLVVVALVGGGLWWVSTKSQERTSQAAAAEVCPPVFAGARWDAPAQEAHSVLVLVDPDGNDPARARTIARQIVPLLTPYLETGLRLELMVHPGMGGVSIVSDCFDGLAVFRVKNEHPTVQQRELSEAAGVLADELEGMIASAPVAAAGGPIPLLQYAGASGQAGQLVVLWSDLLANDGSCLDAEGAEASWETAAAVVDRCVAVGAVESLDAEVVLLGAGQTARAAGFEYWAVAVGEGLCEALTGKSECAAGPPRGDL